MVAFQITVAFDETTTLEDVDNLFKVFAGGKPVSMITYYISISQLSIMSLLMILMLIYIQVSFTAASLAPEVQSAIPSGLVRKSPYLTHPIFNTYIPFHKL